MSQAISLTASGELSTRFGLDFLLHFGLRTDKHIRGPMAEWAGVLASQMRHSAAARALVLQRLLAPDVLRGLLLECPAVDLRMLVADIIRELLTSAFARDSPDAAQNCAETLLVDQLVPMLDKVAKLYFLHKFHAVQDVAANWKRFGQYFKVFADYADLGLVQRQQLLTAGVLPNMAQLVLQQSFSSKFHRPDFSCVWHAWKSSFDPALQPFCAARRFAGALDGCGRVPRRVHDGGRRLQCAHGQHILQQHRPL